MTLTEVSPAFLDDPPPYAPCPHASITLAEISNVLSTTSNKSTSGPSGHNYKLVKWAFSATPDCFQNLFEACLRTGHHLEEWQSATIAIVPKPEKEDYSLPKCYCPIALLECIGKLLEKVITKCITHDIVALSLILTTQFGARHFSSTIDVGLCLTHDVETTHTLGGVCGTLLFDIQGSFDNVNHNRLIALIESLGFVPETCRWVSSFLKDRSVRLCFNSYTSKDIELEMGTPQGSPISPVLSIIYTSPLLHLAKCWMDASFMMYVDDGNLYAQAPTYQLLEQKIQSYYEECHAWCIKAGLTIEPEKTEIIFFSCMQPNPALHGTRPTTVYLPSWEQNMYYTVTVSNHVHYLRIHFDHKLSWDKHISVVVTRTKGTLKSLQLLRNSV
jgi:hypothetical protein